MDTEKTIEASYLPQAFKSMLMESGSIENLVLYWDDDSCRLVVDIEKTIINMYGSER